MSKRQNEQAAARNIMACPRALTIKEVFLRYPMLARTLARVERLMREYEPSQVPLDDSDAHIYQQEQTALDAVCTLYLEKRQESSLTLPDMTRLEYCLICFKAGDDIAVHVMVEWDQEERKYWTTVVIVRMSFIKVEFSEASENTSGAVDDVCGELATKFPRTIRTL